MAGGGHEDGDVGYVSMADGLFSVQHVGTPLASPHSYSWCTNHGPPPPRSLTYAEPPLPRLAFPAAASVLLARLARERMGRRDHFDGLVARLVLESDVHHAGHDGGCGNLGEERPIVQGGIENA